MTSNVHMGSLFLIKQKMTHLNTCGHNKNVILNHNFLSPLDSQKAFENWKHIILGVSV